MAWVPAGMVITSPGLAVSSARRRVDSTVAATVDPPFELAVSVPFEALSEALSPQALSAKLVQANSSQRDKVSLRAAGNQRCKVSIEICHEV